MITIQIKAFIFVALMSITITGRAQVKLGASIKGSMTIKSAATLVNKTYEEPSLYAMGKSSLALGAPVYELAKGYDKKIHISYQIASLNALEWFTVQRRVADILNSADIVALSNAGLYPAVEALVWNEYVPISRYAPLTIKLNFNFIDRTFPYYHHPEDFGRINRSASIHTKTMLIKK
jgi:hypothetical protein